MTSFSEALPMTSAYFALILRELGTSRRARATLLDGTDVSERDLANAEIALGQQLRQIRNVPRLAGRGWALSIAARFHPATHGPLGFAAVSAPTLRQSVEVMTRFSSVRAPHFRLRAVADRDEIRLVPEDRVELADDEHAALLDIVLLSTQGLVEASLGRPFDGARFELPFAARGESQLYERSFHGPVRFACREAAVVIPAEWLDLGCPLADPITFDACVQRLHSGERRLGGRGHVAARVEQLLGRAEHRLGADAAARLLRLSRRTLVRRLRENGTSFRELRDAARRRQAEELLRDRELGLAEIGYAVGFDDAANFGRACRRWFGTSPAKARKRLMDDRC